MSSFVNLITDHSLLKANQIRSISNKTQEDTAEVAALTGLSILKRECIQEQKTEAVQPPASLSLASRSWTSTPLKNTKRTNLSP